MNILLISLNPKFLNHHHHKTVGLLKAKYKAIPLLTKYHNFHHNRLPELQEKYSMAILLKIIISLIYYLVIVFFLF